MTSEEETLAIALWAERKHGDQAAVWIAAQIGLLALAGDGLGVERWKAIAAAWQALQARSLQ